MDNLFTTVNKNAAKIQKETEFRKFSTIPLHKERVATILIPTFQDVMWIGDSTGPARVISRVVLIDGEKISLEEADQLLIHDFRKISEEIQKMYIAMGLT